MRISIVALILACTAIYNHGYIPHHRIADGGEGRRKENEASFDNLVKRTGLYWQPLACPSISQSSSLHAAKERYKTYVGKLEQVYFSSSRILQEIIDIDPETTETEKLKLMVAATKLNHETIALVMLEREQTASSALFSHTDRTWFLRFFKEHAKNPRLRDPVLLKAAIAATCHTEAEKLALQINKLFPQEGDQLLKDFPFSSRKGSFSAIVPEHVRSLVTSRQRLRGQGRMAGGSSCSSSSAQ